MNTSIFIYLIYKLLFYLKTINNFIYLRRQIKLLYEDIARGCWRVHFYSCLYTCTLQSRVRFFAGFFRITWMEGEYVLLLVLFELRGWRTTRVQRTKVLRKYFRKYFGSTFESTFVLSYCVRTVALITKRLQL